MNPTTKTRPRSSSAPSKRPSNPPPSFQLHRPRFIIIPFFGSQIRAILEGEETWYLRDDVLKALGLTEDPLWNQHLFPHTQQTTAIWTDSEKQTMRYDVISESGFYKMLCLGDANAVGLAFNLEGGHLIYDIPGPGQDFGNNEREFFRNKLRKLHSNWLRHEAPAGCRDEWHLAT